MNKGFSTYQENSTMGMSQLDLILMVYRGAISLLDQAKSDFSAQQFTSGRTACDKARKCIVHLYTTLDMEQGGEIAQNLGRLYAYMIEQLDVAVASKSEELLDSIIGFLKTIKEGWDGLKEQEPTTDSPSPSEAAPATSGAAPPERRGLTLSA
jgi:flagellar protein FliS